MRRKYEIKMEQLKEGLELAQLERDEAVEKLNTGASPVLNLIHGVA